MSRIRKAVFWFKSAKMLPWLSEMRLEESLASHDQEKMNKDQNAKRLQSRIRQVGSPSFCVKVVLQRNLIMKPPGVFF
jgi:hypothetical protein